MYRLYPFVFQCFGAVLSKLIIYILNEILSLPRFREKMARRSTTNREIAGTTPMGIVNHFHHFGHLDLMLSLPLQEV